MFQAASGLGLRRGLVGVYRRRCLSTAALPPNLPAGSLLVWGKPDDGRLGMKVERSFGAKDVLLGPVVPPTVNPHLTDVVQVVCSASKTLALTKDGSVYSWGSCQNLSLGHGDDVRSVLRPKRVEALAGIRIVQISAGETASAAVSEDGDVYTWGWGGGWGQGTRAVVVTVRAHSSTAGGPSRGVQAAAGWGTATGRPSRGPP